MSSLLRIEQVARVFNPGKVDELTALDDIDLSIDTGDCVALTGPSGSGKTTLLSLIGCMARPTRGRIFLGERNISALPERFLATIRRESFGFIFQQYHLIRDLSVLENLMLPLYPTAQSWKQIAHRADTLLQRFELQTHRKHKVRLLSGGEQQRVAIARALMNDPDIIIADEPTAHLDAALSAQLIDLLIELRGEGKTLVIATHDPQLYESALVTRHIRLRHGRLVGADQP